MLNECNILNEMGYKGREQPAPFCRGHAMQQLAFPARIFSKLDNGAGWDVLLLIVWIIESDVFAFHSPYVAFPRDQLAHFNAFML